MIRRILMTTLALVVSAGLAGVSQAQDAKANTGTAKGKAKAAPVGDKAKADAAKVKTEKATFGGGCFWCLEAVFERVPGVKSVVSGYAGGTVAKPSYEDVCTGLTGHAEVIQVEYDPEAVSYEKLVKLFFGAHDPTTLNSQGPDFGTQYRSIILYQTDEQKQAAKKVYDDLTAAKAYDGPIVTELVPLKKFYPAEKHHQDYYRRNRDDPYCQQQIVPKLEKLKQQLAK